MDKGRRSCMAWTSSRVAAKYNFCGLQCLGYEQHDQGFKYRQGDEIFASPNRPARFWSPPSLLLHEYRDCFRGGESAETRVTPHCLVRRFKMSENIPHVREGVGYVKIQLSFILFIMLTTTCFGHCGPSSGHKNIYRGKLRRVWP